MAVQQRQLNAWFGEHWLRGTPERFRERLAERLRATREISEAILTYCPPCPEQSRAITRLRDYLDECLLEIWVSHLPPHTSWADVYFGDHWLGGFRSEDRDAAKAILNCFRQATKGMDEEANIYYIRAAWQAAMRALRCFA